MGRMMGAVLTIILLQFALGIFFEGGCMTVNENAAGLSSCEETAAFGSFIPGTAIYNWIFSSIGEEGGTCSIPTMSSTFPSGVNYTVAGAPNELECESAIHPITLKLGIWTPGNPFSQYLNLTLVITAGIVAGLFMQRPDFLFYLAIAGVFLTFGATYFNAYSIMKSEFGAFIPHEILALFMLCFMIPWVIIVLEFPRGRD